MDTDAVGQHLAHQAIASGDAFPRDALRELVATKPASPVSVPDLPARPSLVDRMSANPGSLALISAPAGWSKSPLVAAWYEAIAAERSCAFLSLAQADDDAPLFSTYMLAALRTVRPANSEGTVPPSAAERPTAP